MKGTRLRCGEAGMPFIVFIAYTVSMDYRRADAVSILRATEIGLCSVCLVLYLEPKNEALLLVRSLFL